MTISNTNNRIQYIGNGVSTSFDFPYVFYNKNELSVISTDTTTSLDTTLIADTDYTITATFDNETSSYKDGGSIIISPAPTSTRRITIFRTLPIVQETDYTPNDSFPEESHETALDKQILISQQLQDGFNRCLKVAESSTITDITLPPPEASKLLGWNDNADAIENKELTGLPAFTGYNNHFLQINSDASAIKYNNTSSQRTALGLGNLAIRDTVNSSYIDNSSVITTKIADNNVSLAKIVDGTANQILTTDASGNPIYVNQQTGFNKPFGTTAGTVCQGDDARIVSLTTPVYSHTTKTANYTATSNDYYIDCNTAGGTFTLSLYTAIGNAGKTLVIGCYGSNQVIIDPFGAQTIDGYTAYGLQSDTSITIMSDGTNWRIVSSLIGNTLLSVNANSVASVEFINLFNSIFTHYELTFIDVMPSSATGVPLKLQVSHNGGSSYISTSSYFNTEITNDYDNVSYPHTSVFLTKDNSSSNAPASNATQGVTGCTKIYNPTSTTRQKWFRTETSYKSSGDSHKWGYNYNADYNSTSAINAIKISFSAGNIASGKMTLRGFR